MLHKTLQSYYRNEPADTGDNHPDGPLWLLTIDELEVLPDGVKVESEDGSTLTIGKDEITVTTTSFGYTPYGIRGIKDD